MTEKRKKMLSPFNIGQTESYRSFSKDWYLSVSVSICGILETFQAHSGHWLLLHGITPDYKDRQELRNWLGRIILLPVFQPHLREYRLRGRLSFYC